MLSHLNCCTQSGRLNRPVVLQYVGEGIPNSQPGDFEDIQFYGPFMASNSAGDYLTISCLIPPSLILLKLCLILLQKM